MKSRPAILSIMSKVPSSNLAKQGHYSPYLLIRVIRSQ